ncbi:hypothetical protein, partial [Paracoccus sp. SY]|uniref:hypothetical protein n=1 Tax=Paracoccus sp. SY TaxID=1330255 RepID=UPI001961D996
DLGRRDRERLEMGFCRGRKRSLLTRSGRACGKDGGAKGSGQGQKRGHGPGTFDKEHERQPNASAGCKHMYAHSLKMPLKDFAFQAGSE